MKIEDAYSTDTVAVEPYADFFGATQYRASSVKGALLVTKGRFDRVWQVWMPDSLATLFESSELGAALQNAVRRLS